tara:strand:+ start:602 stop:850 length:249 start_codon:yes stop_codon:yes gene_type:complete
MPGPNLTKIAPTIAATLRQEIATHDEPTGEIGAALDAGTLTLRVTGAEEGGAVVIFEILNGGHMIATGQCDDWATYCNIDIP